MPDRYVHKKISELLLGDACEETHKAMDKPVKDMGRGHRQLYHDLISASLIGLVNNGYKGVVSAAMHIATDKYVNNAFYKDGLKLLLEAADYFAGKHR